ncbi:hypothetical protein glysoja_033293 [Glycine soja]|uniref:Uncharacterized protein n=1 Tax=Glycine soja TaxID=3848 RepID=A0A0B2SVW4_GLYSO|nr:hypothetical protein glysoja_033293 [Glycine soja]
MQKSLNPQQFVGMVIGNLTQAIQVSLISRKLKMRYQSLHEKGARKFGFVGFSPLSCLPALRALNLKANKSGCFEAASILLLL